MSDFFAGVTGFKFPDTLRNKGPLPSVVGGPAGSNGTPDAVINGSSSLLSNITPYAKGESARMGSDSNYQQIPWRMQYIIPQLFIPSFLEHEGSIAVTHAVDQGDIAFRLYTKDRPWFTSSSSSNVALRPAALVCFGNLDNVNYILACLQHSDSGTWDALRAHLTYNRSLSAQEKFNAIRRLVRQNFTPHGICAGSEHQGGKHEGSQMPIQPGRAVNFVTTMTIDGKNEDLVNYWYGQDLSAGDTLLFTLEEQTPQVINDQNYQMTRYYKQPVRKSIHLPETTGSTWQLVARVHKVNDKLPVENAKIRYDYRVAGYWRIAQTFQCRRKSQSIRGQTNGPLLEVTFAPVWMDFSYCIRVPSSTAGPPGAAAPSRTASTASVRSTTSMSRPLDGPPGAPAASGATAGGGFINPTRPTKRRKGAGGDGGGGAVGAGGAGGGTTV